MKRLALIVMILFSLFITSCKKEEKTDEGILNEVSIITPNGTPLLAIGGIANTTNINVTNTTAQADLLSGLTKGEADIVIAPITLGLKTYAAGTNKYKLDSVLTTNNSYLVSKNDVTLSSINDVSGKKITAFGQKNTPGIILEEALKDANITAEIDYLADVATVMSNFRSGVSDCADYVLLAEPQITQLKVKFNMELNVLNLTDDVSPQAAMFVNPNSDHIDDVNKVITLIKNNVEELNDNANDYAAKIVSYNDYFTSLGEEVIKQSIPKCNISYLKAKNNTTILNTFYTLLNDYNSSILNGVTVSEEFYY